MSSKEHMKLLEKIEERELDAVVSQWTGNDDSNRYNVCKVNVTETRDLVLRWRKSEHDEPVLVGYYRMYPVNLIAEGFCRQAGGKIVVSLYHLADGRITLSLKREGKKKIELGKVVL